MFGQSKIMVEFTGRGRTLPIIASACKLSHKAVGSHFVKLLTWSVYPLSHYCSSVVAVSHYFIICLLLSPIRLNSGGVLPNIGWPFLTIIVHLENYQHVYLRICHNIDQWTCHIDVRVKHATMVIPAALVTRFVLQILRITNSQQVIWELSYFWSNHANSQ